MTKYFKATFSNGRVVKRSSVGRTYTHAWIAGHGNGFASSEELARKAAASYQHYHPELLREVVPVEEIVAKEYRLKQVVTHPADKDECGNQITSFEEVL